MPWSADPLSIFNHVYVYNIGGNGGGAVVRRWRCAEDSQESRAFQSKFICPCALACERSAATKI